MNSDLDGKGEILIGDGSGDPTALAVGTDTHVLTADSSEATGVKWAAASGGGGGGGALEFVSKTSLSSSVSEIDFTSLADDSVYYIICKALILSGNWFPKIKVMDSSNTILTGCLSMRRDLASGLTAASGADELNCYAGAFTDRCFCTIEVGTKANANYIHYRGSNGKDDSGCIVHASLDSSHTSDRIGGIRIFPVAGTFDSGTQVLLYKYKES